MMRIRDGRRGGRQVRVGASDSALTPTAGLVAVTELCDRLRLIESIDQAAGPIKQRNRGHGLGELLVGMAAAQLAGEDFLVGLDRQRADAAGQVLTPVRGLAASTAVGLARCGSPEIVEGSLCCLSVEASILVVDRGLSVGGAVAALTVVEAVTPVKHDDLCGSGIGELVSR